MTDDDERARPDLRLAASNGQQLGPTEWRRRPVEDEDLIAALADLLATGAHGDPAVEMQAEALAGEIVEGQQSHAGPESQ